VISTLAHATQSEVADGGDTTLVQPSDWNAEHRARPGLTYYAFEEDFVWNDATDLTAGLGWDFNSHTAIQFVAGEDAHPGILRVTRNTASTAFMAADLSSTTDRPFHTRTVVQFTWVLRWSTISSTSRIRFGLGSVTAAEFGANGVYFQHSAGTSAKWQAVTRSGSTNSTVTSSGADVAANTWYECSAVYDQSAVSWEFFVNGSSIGTSSSQIPNTMTNFGLSFLNNSGSIQQFDLDYVGVVLKYPGTRYA
jgi:hypothetical protein